MAIVLFIFFFQFFFFFLEFWCAELRRTRRSPSTPYSLTHLIPTTLPSQDKTSMPGEPEWSGCTVWVWPSPVVRSAATMFASRTNFGTYIYMRGRKLQKILNWNKEFWILFYCGLYS